MKQSQTQQKIGSAAGDAPKSSNSYIVGNTLGALLSAQGADATISGSVTGFVFVANSDALGDTKGLETAGAHLTHRPTLELLLYFFVFSFDVFGKSVFIYSSLSKLLPRRVRFGGLYC